MTQDSGTMRRGRTRAFGPTIRVIGATAVLAGLAACAGAGPQMPAAVEAAQYREQARSHYQAPGPAWDPWGPYIKEASARFDVPDSWIRAVMHQESGGHEFVVSAPRAMGLMQVMPATYDELRDRHELGSDSYDPHNNILGGTAFIRQMYDVYGTQASSQLTMPVLVASTTS